MAYMVYQRLTTAILKAYLGSADAAFHGEMAEQYRRWLASLQIEPGLRDPLVEQAGAIEEAFRNAATQV